MEFVFSFLGRHFAGKPVVVPQNVGCFLELHWMRIIRGKTNWDSLGFWIPLCGFRIPGTGFWYLSVELGFWFQLLDGFRIPWAVFRIPTIKRLLFVFVFYNKFEVKVSTSFSEPFPLSSQHHYASYQNIRKIVRSCVVSLRYIFMTFHKFTILFMLILWYKVCSLNLKPGKLVRR